ncbi:UDP-3-O-(3-hydroxymyristoyl)glucosamine N-acyltransferase [Acetomicrobium mobile]|uniref:UDP-3-O-(3-hydroxymyristoyl)glucosamine N-acyltransferase n=1 Tax=Acetomicrobium mobile TaxID=97477 RepID=UPI0026E94A6A|nr:UDP-3-O-(3-hydroxymyristoyl)glucosamine N-acyltransferase [Acetomicrobium mobile]
MVRASKIAQFLNKELKGPDIEIVKPCSVKDLQPKCITFAKNFSDDILECLVRNEECLALVTTEYEGKINCAHIVSDNPRLDFARTIAHFFQPAIKAGIAKTAILGDNVKIGEGVTIGEYCVIGNNVSIGNGTVIRNHVVIYDGTVIGNDCLIRSSTIIGEEGFGFERDKDQVPIRLPHLGRVVIGNNVEIGALSTVARGTLDDTWIGDNVKIDDHVHIAHNVHVGKNTIITACSEVSGSTSIGANSWLAPNCSIMNGISLGENVFVGLGAVVTKPVESGRVVVGNPARVLR